MSASNIITDQELRDLVSAGRVSSFHQSRDVGDLLGDALSETEAMDTEDSPGGVEGNSDECQDGDNLTALGKGDGSAADALVETGTEVTSASALMEDLNVSKVDDLRKAALESMSVKPLDPGSRPSATAKRPKLSSSLTSGNSKVNSPISTSSGGQWVGGYQCRMDQNFLNKVASLNVQVNNEIVSPPPLRLQLLPSKQVGFRGSSRRLTEKRVSLLT